MRGQTIAPFSRPRGAGALARVQPFLFTGTLEILALVARPLYI